MILFSGKLLVRLGLEKNKVKFRARKSFQNLMVHYGILIDEMKNILACFKSEMKGLKMRLVEEQLNTLNNKYWSNFQIWILASVAFLSQEALQQLWLNGLHQLKKDSHKMRPWFTILAIQNWTTPLVILGKTILFCTMALFQKWQEWSKNV